MRVTPVGATVEPSLIEGGLGTWSITVRMWCFAPRDGFSYESAREKVLAAITDSSLELDIADYSFREYSPLFRVWDFDLTPRIPPITENPFDEAMAAFAKLKEVKTLREKERQNE